MISKIIFITLLLYGFPNSKHVSSSILSSLNDCQDPSDHFLNKKLEFHVKRFQKKYLNYSNYFFEKHYDRSYHDLTKEDPLIVIDKDNYFRQVRLKRYDRYPFEINIISKFKYSNCENQYQLMPILARGLCNARKMEWEWNFELFKLEDKTKKMTCDSKKQFDLISLNRNFERENI
ncbi:hypothetical protein BpHYR1_021712 [Brachionus plicatilis]|uniref:Uncharacterized protein n=1 Tax=Brachionus plicatilis TaxID=10195 RepID=A0A3M7T5P1_BRAPC|nr:hypothetical protein BpHYR1_021712 [Brachionus plicatilis]